MKSKSDRRPTRRCIVCNTRADKKSLIRFATDDGEVRIDREGRLQSRGCYICPNSDCINKAAKKNALSRYFKREIDNSIYEELKSEYDGS